MAAELRRPLGIAVVGGLIVSQMLKRAAQPEEIAPAFVFLAAPSCSSYITGEILPIIGGY
jgi:NAD(P)-dependent dehydrogenase (short-subunit alcohol dehydrogenase family)